MIRQLPNTRKIYSAGHKYRPDGNCITIKSYPKNREYLEIPSGSILCSLIRSEALQKTGLLDERFEIYFDSNDLGFRLRKYGYKNFCLLKAVAYHERDLTKNTLIQKFFIHRNKFLFWWKHNKTFLRKIIKNIRGEINLTETTLKSIDYVPYDLSKIIVKYMATKEAVAIITKDKTFDNYREPRLEDYSKLNQFVFYNEQKFIN